MHVDLCFFCNRGDFIGVTASPPSSSFSTHSSCNTTTTTPSTVVTPRERLVAYFVNQSSNQTVCVCVCVCVMHECARVGGRACTSALVHDACMMHACMHAVTHEPCASVSLSLTTVTLM